MCKCAYVQMCKCANEQPRWIWRFEDEQPKNTQIQIGFLCEAYCLLSFLAPAFCIWGFENVWMCECANECKKLITADCIE